MPPSKHDPQSSREKRAVSTPPSILKSPGIHLKDAILQPEGEAWGAAMLLAFEA
jgi:hypothetical protein